MSAVHRSEFSRSRKLLDFRDWIFWGTCRPVLSAENDRETFRKPRYHKFKLSWTIWRVAIWHSDAKVRFENHSEPGLNWTEPEFSSSSSSVQVWDQVVRFMVQVFGWAPEPSSNWTEPWTHPKIICQVLCQMCSKMYFLMNYQGW